MKKLKILSGILCIIALTITSCQTDTVNENLNEKDDFGLTKRVSEEANQTVVKYNYTYNREHFSISYTVDNESGEIINTEGDTDRARSYFENSDGPGAILFSNLEDRGSQDEPTSHEPSPEYLEIDVVLFDSVEEMELEVERSSDERFPNINEAQTESGESCTSAELGGSGIFYYYKYIYYNTEMTGLRRTYKDYFRNHWVGSSYNDQMSSFAVKKPYNRNAYAVLYQHACFEGKAIGFYQGIYAYGFDIANLQWYQMSGWLWWSTSWNDQVSSLKGYSW